MIFVAKYCRILMYAILSFVLVSLPCVIKAEKAKQSSVDSNSDTLKTAHRMKKLETPTNPVENGIQPPLKPNVVIFIADDLGIGDVGCFGNDTIRTPNIDRIAREGAKLTHNLAAEAICTPSRAALMTGRYPIRSGMASPHIIRVIFHTSATSGLPANETTIAEAAKSNGYTTGLIGKWHLGVHCGLYDLYCHHPIKQGFDHFFGIPLTNAKDFGESDQRVIYMVNPNFFKIVLSIVVGGAVFAYFIAKFGRCGQIFALFLIIGVILPTLYAYFCLNESKFLNCMLMRNFDVIQKPIDYEHITQNLVNEGVRFLEHSKDGGRPFLLIMPWLQVHPVLHASKKFKGKSRHGDYGDNVEEMDWSVGEIMKALERLEQLENTLVFFTSDNGGHLEESHHGQVEGGWNGIYRGGKGQGGMDGGIRMPTVAMWKNHIRPGTIIDVPTSHMDILPTLMFLWGNDLPTDRVIDGKNIYPLLTGRDSTPPHRFLFHYCGTEIHSARYTPDNGGDVYKMYYYVPNWLEGTYGCASICHCGHAIRLTTPQLYNIGRDPAEKTPLSLSVDEPNQQKIASLIEEAVADHRKSVQAVPNQFAVHRMIPLPWLQPCCNFPHCQCDNEVTSTNVIMDSVGENM